MRRSQYIGVFSRRWLDSSLFAAVAVNSGGSLGVSPALNDACFATFFEGKYFSETSGRCSVLWLRALFFGVV